MPILTPTFRARSGLTFNPHYVRVNSIHPARLQSALERLTIAIRDVESEIATMKTQHDPLALHIFVARRSYRNVADTKGANHPQTNPPTTFNTPLDLAFPA